MEQQQIEKASDLILDSIINSNLDKFTKTINKYETVF